MLHIQGQPAPFSISRRLSRVRVLVGALSVGVVLCSVAHGTPAFADKSSPQTQAEAIAEGVTDMSPAGQLPITSWLEAEADSEGGFIGAPAIFYTPETSVLFGLGGMYYLPTVGARGRVSQITAAAAYTLKDQVLVDIKPNFFFDRGRYHLFGEYRYSYFPDTFFGVGNKTQPGDAEDMVLSSFRARTYVERRLGEVFYVGFLHEVERHDVLEVTAGGALDAEQIPGQDGAFVSGLGAMLTYDSRDQTLTPTSGSFVYGSAALFVPELGSEHRFGRFVIDARKFLAFAHGHVFAMQAVLKFCHGEPPFQVLPDLGGGKTSRGYFGGRFRDRHQLFAQVEYRAHIWWRIGGAAFLSAGQVARTLREFDFGEWHPSGGVGLRFLIDQDAGANLRFDVGVGTDSFGVYFDAGEAF